MKGVDFATVYAGVRPPRLAVLVDNSDQNWQETCRRIIEFLSWMWGGQYSMIIPTDGSTIAPRFWKLLEAFDPDYLCLYTMTGLDLKISSAENYQRLVEHYIMEQHPEQQIPEGARNTFDDAIQKTQLRTAELSSELQAEIKRRLAPFWHRDRVGGGVGVGARVDPRYPLTSISTILPYSERPSRINIIESRVGVIPKLWVESITGSAFQEHLDVLAANGVEINHTSYEDSDVGDLLQLVLVGDFLKTSPHQFSMLGLSTYRSANDRWRQMPHIVVYGATLEDFALYFNLSRIRNHVYWLLPDWMDQLRATRAQRGQDSSSVHVTELPASCFARILQRVSATNHTQRIDFMSTSQSNDAIEAVIDDLDSALPIRNVDGIKARGCIRENLDDAVLHPNVVFNTDNFAVPTTHQLAEERIVGRFPTPKPKGFTKIVPFEHRWITELRIEGHVFPRHPVLGEWIIRDSSLSTEEVRVGVRGVCYFCPKRSYFGGDIDTILVRPKLSVPGGSEIFNWLAEDAGWKSKLSDKGFYSRETVAKVGSLEFAALLFRSPRHLEFLREYLKGAGTDSARGMFLNADQRRYLEFASIETILGDKSSAVLLVDSLISEGILHRGLILKCEYCRAANWFHLSDLGEGFRCKRCRGEQPILSKHACQKPEPVWYYQLDEIVYQGLKNNMHVPLLALDHLRRNSKSFLYVDELNMWKPAGNENLTAEQGPPFIEIDLCCVCDGVLTIGEAKTAGRIESGGKSETRSLEKYKEAALALGARRFILATSEVWSEETRANASRAFADTAIEVVFLTGSDIL